MKNAKKIVGLLIVLAMAICMTIPAYAETTGTITVTNPQADETYTAYKIFDVVYSGDNYAYTIEKSSPWYNAVNAYATAENGLTLTPAASDPNLFTVNFSDTFRAAGLAAALKAALTAETNPVVDNNGKTLANGTATVELGYYFVSTTTGTVCNLTTTNPSASIIDKNEKQAIEKTAKVDDPRIGATVYYTITGEVPSTVGYATYLYEVKDTMSKGLTFKKDVTVKFGDTAINDGTLTYTDNGFTLSYDMTKYQQYVGQTITITYTAIINADAVTEGTKNTATLKYSNDPNNNNSYGGSGSGDPSVPGGDVPGSSIVDILLTNVDITKVDGANKEKTLDGAEFKLYKKDGDTKFYYKAVKEADKITSVEWVTDATQATVVATENGGKAQFDAVPAGTYYLEETKAPDGYNILAAPFTVTINTAVDGQGKNILTGNAVTVENNAGALLPSTGGIGTTIFYVLGTVLIAGAFILIVTKKRMSTEK